MKSNVLKTKDKRVRKACGDSWWEASGEWPVARQVAVSMGSSLQQLQHLSVINKVTSGLLDSSNYLSVLDTQVEVGRPVSRQQSFHAAEVTCTVQRDAVSAAAVSDMLCMCRIAFSDCWCAKTCYMQSLRHKRESQKGHLQNSLLMSPRVQRMLTASKRYTTRC